MSIGAILFLTREHPDAPPLFLENLLFSPVAVWLSQALQSAGVEDFLVTCDPRDREQALPCFPEGTVFLSPKGSQGIDHGEEFQAFLKHETLLFITLPLLLGGGLTFVPSGTVQQTETGMYRLQGKDFARAISEGMILEKILVNYGQEVNAAAVLPLQGGDPTLWQMYQGQAQILETQRLHSLGVRFIDPSTCYTDPTVQVGRGTTLLPNTILRGKTVVGEGCTIGPNVMIQDSSLGDRVTVNASQIFDSTVEHSANIGPFSYIRPHSHVGEGVKVGDFVEVKNATLGKGTKISHLTYVGDADVGENVNFGCGTVLVNYDGANKHRTTIEDNAFIGCNTNLVSPVTIGKGAFTAAGSTITGDVPPESLAIARTPQTVKPSWQRPKKKS